MATLIAEATLANFVEKINLNTARSMTRYNVQILPAVFTPMFDDGSIANERAKWVPSFLEGKTKGWFLSMAVWHMAEHLLGGVVCVRRVSGVPVGL